MLDLPKNAPRSSCRGAGIWRPDREWPAERSSGFRRMVNERVIVEHSWSQAGATGGNRSQTDQPR